MPGCFSNKVTTQHNENVEASFFPSLPIPLASDFDCLSPSEVLLLLLLQHQS